MNSNKDIIVVLKDLSNFLLERVNKDKKIKNIKKNNNKISKKKKTLKKPQTVHLKTIGTQTRYILEQKNLKFIQKFNLFSKRLKMKYFQFWVEKFLLKKDNIINNEIFEKISSNSPLKNNSYSLNNNSQNLLKEFSPKKELKNSPIYERPIPRLQKEKNLLIQDDYPKPKISNLPPSSLNLNEFTLFNPEIFIDPLNQTNFFYQEFSPNNEEEEEENFIFIDNSIILNLSHPNNIQINFNEEEEEEINENFQLHKEIKVFDSLGNEIFDNSSILNSNEFDLGPQFTNI